METCVDYGQLIKIKENGKVIRKERRIIFGSPSLEDINTTNIENFNGILRKEGWSEEQSVSLKGNACFPVL